jgi:hypothetical protein
VSEPRSITVNLGMPTVHDEIDSALQFYSDGSRIDLVLVSGCGNDVGVQNLLNASKIEEVDFHFRLVGNSGGGHILG